MLRVVTVSLVALLWAAGLICAEDPVVTFDVTTTLAEVGRTRAIAFRTTAAAETDRALALADIDATVLEVTRAPMVLAGQTLGWMRVRGVRPGATQVRLGGAVLRVEVVPRRAGPDSSMAGRPRIVGPADGAVVWGRFAAGVEIDDLEPAPGSSVELRLSTGQRLPPEEDGFPACGPLRRCVFAIDAEKLAAGECFLQAVVSLADGTEQVGERVRVHVVHPSADRVHGVEAEDPGDVVRPERVGKERPLVLVDPQASGDEYVSNAGARPAVCVPFTAAVAGEFQVFMTARGTWAGGALPSVGLTVDNGDQPLTNGALVCERWHRLALGVPIRLEAGAHVLVPWYMNDFGAGALADRNLYLDRIEVLAIDEVRAGAPTDSAEGAMQSMTGMAAAETGEVRLAWAGALHNMQVTGTFEARALCAWTGRGKTPPPWVTLCINGRPVERQRSAAPRFWIDPGALVAGENTLQLRAGSAVTAEVVVTWRGVEAAPPRGVHRVTVYDEGWDDEARKRLGARRDPPELRCLDFSSNGAAALALPDDWTGAWDVWLEALGDHYQGPPIATVTLRAGGSEVAVGQANAPGNWDPVAAGRVTLPSGPKHLVIAFANDLFEKGKGDRNLAVQAVLLREVGVEDRVAPRVEVRYPAPGQELWELDAVVAEVAEDRDLARLELLVDGAPQFVQDGNRRLGRFVLPLVLRGVPPGEHEVAVRARDQAGHAATTAPVRIRVLAAAPAAPGPYARAVRLLDRFAFGPEARELAAVLTQGETAWLTERLGAGPDDPGERSAWDHSLLFYPNERNAGDVQGRVILHALTTQNPVRARLLAWVENHFSTWMRKTQPELEWPEHERFWRLGAAPFGELLAASATSPGMLRYLDQQQSLARRLNENYAREILELHTVGVDGGYAQADVTALAHLLTGWTFCEEGDGHSGGPGRRRAFRYDPQLNEGEARVCFGVRYPRAAPAERYDRARSALEVFAAHPATARFVCGKLVAHYAGPDVAGPIIDDLARVFLSSHGDLRAVLTALAAHPALAAAPPRIATPFDYAIRLSRVCGIAQPGAVQEFLQRSAMGVFERSTPDGYPEEDAAWSSTNAMLQRWRLARRADWALVRLLPPDRMNRLNTKDAAVDAQAADLLAARLLGRLPSEHSRRALLDVLQATDGNGYERARAAAVLLAQLPEANVR